MRLSVIDQWYPKAFKNVIQHPRAVGGTYVGYPWRGVLHSTESTTFKAKSTDYFGHHNPPHFTVYKGQVYQHFPLLVSARALANPPGGVQTNRGNAIQIEIVAKAAKINKTPKSTRKALKELIEWLNSELGIRAEYYPHRGGPEGYGPEGAYRMSAREWLEYNAWCCHANVPENSHWDIGNPDTEFLRDIGLLKENKDPLHTEDRDPNKFSFMDFIQSIIRLFTGK